MLKVNGCAAQAQPFCLDAVPRSRVIPLKPFESMASSFFGLVVAAMAM